MSIEENIKRRQTIIKTIVVCFVILTINTALHSQTIVSLDECINLASTQNKELKQKQIEVNSAELKKDEVLTYFFPQISAKAGWIKSQEPIRLVDWDYSLGWFSKFVPSFIKDKTELASSGIMLGNVMAVQPLFMGGKIINGYNMASSGIRLKKAMLQTEENKVKSDIIDTYWKVVSLASKERLLNKLTALLSDARSNVDLAVETGVATKADALAIRVKQSEAEVNLNKVKDGLHLLQMLLAEQCGLPSDTRLIPRDVYLLDSIKPVSSLSDTTNIEKDINIDRAVQLRSEVRSLSIADTVFMNKERMQIAETLPKVFGILSYTTLSPNPFNAPRNSFGSSWSVGIGVSIPITGIWQGAIKYKEAHNERMSYRIKKEDAEAKIRLQIKQQIYSLKEANKNLTAAAEGLANAEENLRYANIGYKEGVIPLLNLTMAQTSWSKAHDAYIDAWINKKIQESKAILIIPQ